jgi:valyl-tRNA synthetase
LKQTERFFWGFCDDYLELVKQRAYGSAGGDGAASARCTLELALSTLLRLFAPHVPFVTEEVWSWWQEGSVHRTAWPDAGALRTAADVTGTDDAGSLAYRVAADVLGAIRKEKTAQQRSMRADVERVVVRDTPERLSALGLVAPDVREAGRVRSLDTAPADELAVDVELAESDAA